MARGDLATVPGKELDSAGQDLLDDILTNSRSVQVPVTSGNFAGGTRYVMPDPSGVEDSVQLSIQTAIFSTLVGISDDCAATLVRTSTARG